MMMDMMVSIEKGKKRKKKKMPDMSEFDDTHYWTKDKGFYGHSSAKKGFAKVTIIGRGK